MAAMVSPKTGELIKIGSEEFSELLADPKYRKMILSSSIQTIEPATTTPSGLPPLPRTSLPPLSSSFPQSSLPPLSPRANLPPLSPRANLPPLSLRANLPPLSPRTSLPALSPRSNPSQTKFAPIPSLEETLKNTKQPSKREKLERMIEEQRAQEGRGIKSRGWAARSPTRGSERHQLKKECGNECFLLPDQEKFPVCQSPRMTGGVSDCRVDCGAAQSALVRARQYNYDDVAEKAKALLQQCNKGGLEHFTPSRSPPLSPRSPRMPSSVSQAGRTDHSPERGRSPTKEYGFVRRQARRSRRELSYSPQRGRSPQRGLSPEREYDRDRGRSMEHSQDYDIEYGHRGHHHEGHHHDGHY